jgi:hypothetical protein
MAPCAFDGCEKPAAPRQGGYCYCHVKQRQRTGRMTPQVRPRHPSLRAMVLEAHNNLADTDPMDSDAWTRAWHRLRMAFRRYMKRQRR